MNYILTTPPAVLDFICGFGRHRISYSHGWPVVPVVSSSGLHMFKRTSARKSCAPPFCAEPLEPRTFLSAAKLVQDLNTAPAAGDVDSLATLHGLTIFAQQGGSSGIEPWVTDGTAKGTYRLKDINPGRDDSDPTDAFVAGQYVFFDAENRGQEQLWRTDGTTGGTIELAQVSLEYDTYAAANGIFYFTTEDTGSGSSLWKSDGTPKGTTLLRTFSEADAPESLTAFKGKVYFSAGDSTHGRELWRSDGTVKGTKFFADLTPGSVSSYLENFYATDDALYFTDHYSFLDKLQQHLWKTDGTSTSIVAATTDVSDISSIGNMVYFVDNFDKLWRTDGTPGGTKLLTTGGDLTFAQRTGQANRLFLSDGSEVRGDRFIPFSAESGSQIGNYFYYSKTDGNDVEFWRTDGSSQGTQQILRIAGGVESAIEIDAPIKVGTEVYFFSYTEEDDGEGDGTFLTQNLSLWKSDGTAAGTAKVQDFPTATSFDIIATTDKLLFTLDEPVYGREMWESDGTAAGTHVIRNNFPGTSDSNPQILGVGVGGMYFAANSTDGKRGLWIKASDSSPPVLLIPNAFAPQQEYALQFFGTFHGSQIIGGDYGIWRTNGTAAGTTQLFQTLPDTESFSSSVTSVEIHGKWIYFNFDYDDEDLNFTDLHIEYRSDGTPQGTHKLKATQSVPQEASVGDQNVAFQEIEQNGNTLDALYSTNVSTGKTTLIHTSGLWPSSLTLFKGELYFTEPYKSGAALWRTDGTSAGTKMVAQINDVPTGWTVDPDNSNLEPGDVDKVTAVVGNTLYFFVGGTDLWKTDGTAAGTQRIKTVFNPAFDPFPNLPVMLPVGSKLFFTGDDPEHGEELWVSDGTPAGTHIVKDIMPGKESALEHIDDAANDGPASTEINQPIAVGDDIYFTADDGVHGFELWRSDGTASGTKMLTDISPEGSNPDSFQVFGNNLFFTATDVLHGRELWELPLS